MLKIDVLGKVSKSFYNKAYFLDLNSSGHEYTLENRRRIEGDHPQILLDTFGLHSKYLDCACGPGYLLYFMKCLGATKLAGFDFSSDAISLAHEDIQSYLFEANIDSFSHKVDKDFDVIICRETFEHLTPLQIFTALQEMVLSLKKNGLIYVTCRLSYSDNKFAVLSEPKVDPSHITLLSREMIEFFFEKMLNMVPKKKLEDKIDHLGKGRCFVYQKVS